MRARGSPAAKRSENSASCCTGVITALPSRQARNPPTASANKNAQKMLPLAPLGSDAKSSMDLSAPASRPAWNASPMTTNSASPFTKTSVQTVELNRDFITSSKLFPVACLSSSAARHKSLSNLNRWPRKNFQKPVQIQNQCQPVVMAQHADAMWYVFRRLTQHVVRRNRIGSHHFVRGNSDSQILVASFHAHRSDHHMFRQQTRTAPFGHGDVNQRHNRAAQIENSHQVARP